MISIKINKLSPILAFCVMGLGAFSQIHGQSILHDAKGELVLPSTVTQSEMDMFKTDSRFTARGVPFDNATDTSMWIYGIPKKYREKELDRIGKNNEAKNYMDMAWTVMLYKQGIIKFEDARKVLKAIKEFMGGEEFDPKNSHTSGEGNLKKVLVGDDHDLASIPQIGRTMQEPMSRMQLRDKQLDVIEGTHSLLGTLLDVIEKHRATIMPGMTHMAHSQPITYGAYLLSVYDGISRTLEQLELAYDHTNENSGGCGANSGTGFDVDRYMVTEFLGFDKLLEPTYDGEAGQDFATSTLFALSNMMLVLSRTAMDHQIWGMDGYQTHSVADYHKGVSSFMPQKAHSGSAWEFVRISGNNVLGSMMTGVFGLHGEPHQDVLTSYQASYLAKQHGARGYSQGGAVGALCEVEMINMVYKDMMKTLVVDKDKLLQLAKDGWGCIPDLAAYLTKEKDYGMRRAHHICAVLVRIARDHRKIKPSQLTGEMLDEAARISNEEEPNLSTEEIQEIMDPVKFIERHNNVGDPNPKETDRMVKIRRQQLREVMAEQAERRSKVENGYKTLMVEVDKIIND